LGFLFGAGSLLRQRTLSDPKKAGGPGTQNGSQSLLRQRTLSNDSEQHYLGHFNFVSIASSPANPFQPWDALVVAVRASGLNRFFASELFPTKNRLVDFLRFDLSQSLLRQRTLSDAERAGLQFHGNPLSQSLLRQRTLSDRCVGVGTEKKGSWSQSLLRQRTLSDTGGQGGIGLGGKSQSLLRQRTLSDVITAALALSDLYGLNRFFASEPFPTLVGVVPVDGTDIRLNRFFASEPFPTRLKSQLGRRINAVSIASSPANPFRQEDFG